MYDNIIFFILIMWRSTLA